MSRLLAFGDRTGNATRGVRRRNAGWNRVTGWRDHLLLLVLGLGLGVVVAGSQPALSESPWEGDVVATTTFGSTVTLQRPKSAATGDVLIASVHARLPGSAAITAPSGWTLIRRDSSAPGYQSLTQALYYKVAGPSDPASYTWSLASSVSIAGAILDVKGADVSMPVDSHSGAFTPESSSFVAPSVTTTDDGDLVVGFFGITTGRTIRPPDAMTELFDVRWQSRS
jgi:hypothetical protein